MMFPKECEHYKHVLCICIDKLMLAIPADVFSSVAPEVVKTKHSTIHNISVCLQGDTNQRFFSELTDMSVNCLLTGLRVVFSSSFTKR